MDYDEVNKELSATRNNNSDWVKAMNDAEWHRILSWLISEESPEEAPEPPPEERQSMYQDYGVKPPASPVAPRGACIFTDPWIYYEIQSVLADIHRTEQAKKTRWARLRKIDKIRRESRQTYKSPQKGLSPFTVYATWNY